MCKNHQRPVILYEGHYTKKDLTELKRAHPIWRVVDCYSDQLKELFKINNPQPKRKPPADYLRGLNQELRGNWIYYPWSGVLVHAATEKDYLALRTNRNKNLITAEEQKRLFNFGVGLVGLSIGNAIAAGLAYAGIGRVMKLAEYDVLETTNLNRMRARLDQLSLPKIEITAQQIYEIDPHIQLSLFCKGLNSRNLRFYFVSPRPKIIFEAIDDFAMKIKLRLMARKFKVPVIMFSNLGDSILIDVERFDLNPKLPLFNGRLGDLPEKILKNPDVTPADKNKYAVQLVGPESVPPRALASVKEIGKTLVGRPQLMSTVTISGGAGAYLARRVALGLPVPSGRRLVKFDQVF